MAGVELDSETMVDAFHNLPTWLQWSGKSLIAGPAAYHSINGLRHLGWDMGYCAFPFFLIFQPLSPYLFIVISQSSSSSPRTWLDTPSSARPPSPPPAFSLSKRFPLPPSHAYSSPSSPSFPFLSLPPPLLRTPGRLLFLQGSAFVSCRRWSGGFFSTGGCKSVFFEKSASDSVLSRWLPPHERFLQQSATLGGPQHCISLLSRKLTLASTSLRSLFLSPTPLMTAEPYRAFTRQRSLPSSPPTLTQTCPAPLSCSSLPVRTKPPAEEGTLRVDGESEGVGRGRDRVVSSEMRVCLRA